MTDFKKQKKFWCDKCNVFVEYNKQSIEHHNLSRMHLYNSTSNRRYSKMKTKFNKYIENLELVNNGKEKLLGNKHTRDDMIKSTNYLSEIKNEMMKNDLNKDLINQEGNNNIENNTQKWGCFFDEKYQTNYYYNFITGESTWEKPIDFEEDKTKIIKDNTDNKIDINNDDNDYKNLSNLKNKEVQIGKWETVNEKDSVFGKRKKSDSSNSSIKENQIKKESENKNKNENKSDINNKNKEKNNENNSQNKNNENKTFHFKEIILNIKNK